jgi:hypothetical protein
MWIFNRPPDQIREDDLQGLIRDRVQENVTLDFKRDMYGGSDAEIRKMLRDVSSLANANGGCLVIGMGEDGEATAAGLVPVPNAEVEANRLVASSAASIADRIAGLRALRIPIQAGDAILVWVPPSYRKPHMITFQGATEFWIRHDRQNVRMSIAEIRSATTATEDLAVKVDQAVRARLQVWEQGGHELLVLMATPLLLQEGRIDTGDRRLAQALASVPEQRRMGAAWLSDQAYSVVVPTLRGRAAQDRAKNPPSHSLEVYRNGHIEFLLEDLTQVAYRETEEADVKIIGWSIAEHIAHFVHFVRGLRELTGITDPYVFTLCLRGCEGWVLYERQPERFDRGPHFAWDEGPTVLVDSIVAPADEAPGRTAQRIADRFWNAFHFERCPFFDQDGRLVLQR